MKSVIKYRCPRKCPIGKNCFIIKVDKPIVEELLVYQKCPAEHGADIAVYIGGK